jgi:hypothetical protein
MFITLNPGYPDLLGRRAAFVGYGAGPVSYVAGGSGTAGDPVSIPGKYIDVVLECPEDPTGTYFAVGRPSAVGPRATWYLRYFVSATGLEVANGTNLSTYNFVVSGFYGEY